MGEGLEIGHIIHRPGAADGTRLGRDLVVFSHAGSVTFRSGIATWIVPPGGLLLAPRGLGRVDWQVAGSEDWEVTWFFQRLDALRLELLSGLPRPRTATVHGLSGLGAGRIEAAFRRLADSQALPGPAAALLRPALVDAIIAEVRIFVGPADATPDPAVAVARSFLDSSLDRLVGLGDVVKACGLGRSVLAERFVRLVGVPPMRYLEERRLLTAAERLRHGGDPVRAIARAVGYSDPRYFATRFRRRFGCTPEQWRRTTG
jgi:AraC-like DNA-binding protein